MCIHPESLEVVDSLQTVVVEEIPTRVGVIVVAGKVDLAVVESPKVEKFPVVVIAGRSALGAVELTD